MGTLWFSRGIGMDYWVKTGYRNTDSISSLFADEHTKKRFNA